MTDDNEMPTPRQGTDIDLLTAKLKKQNDEAARLDYESGVAFDAAKATDLIIFLALKAGGSIGIRRLAMLAYLGERERLDRYEMPLTHGLMVAAPDGPVLLAVLAYPGGTGSDNGERDARHAPTTDGTLTAPEKMTFDDLGHLSEADVEILEDIWTRYGHHDGAALGEIARAECAEWRLSAKANTIIHYEAVLAALGKGDIDGILEEIDIATAIAAAPRRARGARRR